VKRLFGTDGIRGEAGQFPLDYSSAYTLGKALVSLLLSEDLPPKILLGRDTRESGEWLEQALIHGIANNGGKASSAGVIPTSAISHLTQKHSFSAGIVISASHNPYKDNGIKIFSSHGRKIPEDWEDRLERVILSEEVIMPGEGYTVEPDPALESDYIQFLKSRLPMDSLTQRIKVVLDCANGASSSIAPPIFSDFGFDVHSINTSPNGRNINEDCGSLYPQDLAAKVTDINADIGIAYDGDADRAIWIDEKGNILNGDHTLYVLSKSLKERGLLKTDKVVTTIMSNMGLEKALEALGIKLIRTQVGDKYVLDKMLNLGTNLGGEQSGHTILLDECPAGDGILTSLKMLEAMIAYNAPLSKLVSGFEEYPQILLNVPVSKREDFHRYPKITDAMQDIGRTLGDSGRFNVRYSGTEPLVRIMVEGKDRNRIVQLAHQMARIVEKYLS
jgi:phosphoglucosamine mutase